MKTRLLLLAVSLIVGRLTLAAQTYVITGRDKISVTAVYSAREAQHKNYCGNLTLSRANVSYHSYLRFDLEGLPNRPVKDAALIIYSSKQFHNSPAQIGIYALNQSFDEKTCTYRNASQNTPWRKNCVQLDSPLATLEVGPMELNCWMAASGENLTKRVSQWLKKPQENHGMLLKLNKRYRGQCFKFFAAKGQKRDELLPKLVISYDGPLDVTHYGVITPELRKVRKLLRQYQTLLTQMPKPWPSKLITIVKRLKTNQPLSWLEEESMNAILSTAWYEAARRDFSGKQLALWDMSPWQRLEKEQLPGKPATGWNETILRDEIHELALGVTNLGPRNAVCSVELLGLPPEAVEIRSSYWVQAIKPASQITPTGDKFQWVDDVLLRLNKNKHFTLKSGHHTRLFVTVRGKELPVGKHSFTMVITTIEGERQTLHGTLTVDSHSLAWPHDLHISSYAYLDRPNTSAYQQQALEDILDHFENTFVSNRNVFPRFDATKKTWDYSVITSYLNFIKQAKPKMLLFFWCGAVTDMTPRKNWNSPEWKQNLATALRGWVKACEDAGFSKKQFAMYPIDEVYAYPRGKPRTAYHDLLDIVKVIKDTDPDIQVFANPICFSKEDNAYLKALQPYVDIWAPIANLYNEVDHVGHPKAYPLGEKYPHRKFFAAEQAAGKPLWTYRCDGPVKNLDLNSYYRQFSWRPWLNGITGLGIWSYNDVRGSSWSDADRGDFTMVYELRDAPEEVTCRTDEKLIPAVRYSAWRRSLQDYVLLDMAAKRIGRNEIEKLVSKGLGEPKNVRNSEQIRNKLISIIINTGK